MNLVVLSEDSNSVAALSHRSEKSTETPDTMWHPGAEDDRIRRSEESTETPDTMWHPGAGDDRIRRSVDTTDIPDAI